MAKDPSEGPLCIYGVLGQGVLRVKGPSNKSRCVLDVF
jgi:hypothetical protein